MSPRSNESHAPRSSALNVERVFVGAADRPKPEAPRLCVAAIDANIGVGVVIEPIEPDEIRVIDQTHRLVERKVLPAKVLRLNQT